MPLTLRTKERVLRGESSVDGSGDGIGMEDGAVPGVRMDAEREEDCEEGAGASADS